jgi:pyridoxal phosphate enzyme (YggS family)
MQDGIEMNKKKFSIEQIEQAIKKTCERIGRGVDEVKLMAVTKTRAAEEVEEALRAGVLLCGENRVQEGVEKRAALGGRGRWELIGPLQSNKVRQAVANFDRIQTIDRVKLVQRVARVAEELGRTPYPVLLQVNVAGDPAKHGCGEAEAAALLEAALAEPALRVEGLMTIGEFSEDAVVQRQTFRRLKQLAERLRGTHGVALEELSMGMSGDYVIAIEEGSTLVRVGTALFGARE